jgi:hypothetical protein
MLTEKCGTHCGIRANAEDTLAREGHCDCGDPCHPDGSLPASGVIRLAGQAVNGTAPRAIDGSPLTGTPMCAAWYERAGDYRPWLGKHWIIRHPAPAVPPADTRD